MRVNNGPKLFNFETPYCLLEIQHQKKLNGLNPTLHPTLIALNIVLQHKEDFNNIS